MPVAQAYAPLVSLVFKHAPARRQLRPHDETRKGRPPARPGVIPAGKFITNLKHDSLLVLPHATGNLGASGPAPGRLSRPRAGGVDQARRMAAKTAAAVTVPLIV